MYWSTRIGLDVNEMVAWAAYKNGDYAKALTHIENALVTGSKNPVLLCKAGLIYTKNNQPQKAAQFLTTALENNPNIDHDLNLESTAAAKTLSL